MLIFVVFKHVHVKKDPVANLGFFKFYYSCDFHLAWLHVRKPIERGVIFSSLQTTKSQYNFG